MAAHNDLGIKGETLAAKFLLNKQYLILETNWRWLKAEVDIIAQDANTIVFIEVKTRSSSTFMKPEEAVNMKKQKMLKDAAEAYCEANSIEMELRFDIISIVKEAGKISIKHMISAF
jgi:putative endonuclease